MRKEDWIAHAEWNLKILNRHLKKALGRVAHARSREKSEIVTHAGSLFTQSQELAGKMGAEPSMQNISQSISFCKKAKKELYSLEKEIHSLALKTHTAHLSHLIEKSMEGARKIHASLVHAKTLPYLEFAEKTHEIVLLMSDEKKSMEDIYSILHNLHRPQGPPHGAGKPQLHPAHANPQAHSEIAHAAFEAQKARLAINELESAARSTHLDISKKAQKARCERLKSHLVNAMLAAHSGKILIDRNGIRVKSTFNGSEEQAFELHEPMQKALCDFFEGQELASAIKELGNGKHAKLVGNFQTEFTDGEPQGIKLSIGAVSIGTEAMVYRPVRMHLEKKHIESAGRHFQQQL